MSRLVVQTPAQLALLSAYIRSESGFQKLIGVMYGLMAEPFPAGSLHTGSTSRVRGGDYVIVYNVSDEPAIVTVTDIRLRR